MDIFNIIILIFLVEVISFFINKGYSLSVVASYTGYSEV